MDKSARSSPLVNTLAVAAVSIAAIGAALSASTGGGSAPQRPPADAPVRVVKSPPQPAVDRLPALCRHCELGAAGRQL